MPENDFSDIGERLERVREHIETACARAGRKSADVTLIGVSKTFPLEAVHAAREAGLVHFGENRVQDLVQKAKRLPGECRGGEVFWYMIGHLQRNKARDVVEHADFFQALDSYRLAEELNRRAEQRERILPCLVEVHISAEESKFGVKPEATHELLDSLGEFPNLRVEGLMTIASFVDDPAQIRSEFRLVRKLFDSYQSSVNPRVEMKQLSMGMSGDF
ncbi:MAG: YggS family pyridoxal phosphate-dependent enzyme, partial [Rhodothermales bacterium]